MTIFLLTKIKLWPKVTPVRRGCLTGISSFFTPHLSWIYFRSRQKCLLFAYHDQLYTFDAEGEGIMITVEKALQIVLDNTPILDTVLTPILDARDMVLAADVIAGDDIPPFDMAMIDGFAMRSEDILRASQGSPVCLKLDGEVRVGSAWALIVQPGHSVKIAAGAPLPDGTDTIVPAEFAVRESAQKVKIYKYEKPGENIYIRGGDIVAGSSVLPKGKELGGADIGVLAALGCNEVLCFRRPRVSFFASGSDLISPDQPLAAGKIRAGNNFALQCHLKEYGAEPINLGIVGTDAGTILDTILKAIESDMFIASGGSSPDDFETVKGLLQRAGMDLKFWKVAIRPGKPLIFGTLNKVPVFGLPGNYLSSLVILEEFVRPAIQKMQGKRDLKRTEVIARLSREVKGGNGITHFVRAEVQLTNDGFIANPAGSRSSSSVMAFCTANGFIVVPSDIGYYNQGDMVKVQLVSEPIRQPQIETELQSYGM